MNEIFTAFIFSPWGIVFICFVTIITISLLFRKPASDVEFLLTRQTATKDQHSHFSCGAHEIRGKRKYMEDRHAVVGNINGDPNMTFYAVFDGHGGALAAEYCVRRLCYNVVHNDYFPHSPKQALIGGFHETDKQFLQLAVQNRLNDGSTVIAALAMGDIIHVANTGDSRAIMVNDNGAVSPLSRDHKPNRPDELKRVNDLGGRVIKYGVHRVQGILALSRAIGDLPLKRYVIPTPEVVSVRKMEQNSFIVLGSDGIWDILSNEMVGQIVKTAASTNESPKEISKRLVNEAFVRGSQDNITAVVIDLRHKVERRPSEVSIC
eukprot:TRINITY_DN6667_c0_g1_i2.p1 TRINITY_DN6667_c0_g1~~TRINITY_DN6667_c0_g1_i2.p1  ORF type:complete len:321 (-),score=67.49 TRINITY_DN6667_c0_g1_i2:156-1118(-)